MKRYAVLVVVSLLSLSTSLQSQTVSGDEKSDDKVNQIGIIGAENSHTLQYGRLFNNERFFPDFHVAYVWGETPELANRAVENAGIPSAVKKPKDMLGKVDAVIIDHRHGKYHLEAAYPFIKEGIPVFIDKPFCYRACEGKKFLEAAIKYNAPVTSYSVIARSRQVLGLKKRIEGIGKINQAVFYGPVDVESQYGGVFYYAVHMVQQMMIIFGDDIEKVRITKNGKDASATVIYKDGLFVSLLFSHHYSGWGLFVETETGFHQMKSYVWDDHPERGYTDMVNMFRTGKLPRSYQSILNGISVLEALERSVETEDWENVEYLLLETGKID